MKKLLTGLFFLTSLQSFAQRWQTIKGDGERKTETRNVTSFNAVSAQGAMNVQISYGTSNTVTVEADENLLPYIETIVENGKLLIRSKDKVNLKTRSKMTVTISMTKINSLQLSGSGNINGEGAFANDGKTTMSVSGSGNLALSFDKFQDLDLAISGSVNIDLKGNGTNSIDAHISGSGNIDCSNINSSNVDAKISGSGNVKVYAENSIDAMINGSGNVFYKGNATKINSHVSGSGKVVKM
jgi:hypothetical protein